jgi:hypothetical protein
MLRLLPSFFVGAALTAMAFAPAPVPKPEKAAEANKAALGRMTGAWLQTSVRYCGEEVYDSPNTGNSMKFEGVNIAEFSGSGRPLLTGKVEVISAEKGIIRVDLPRKVFSGGGLRTVTVAAIVRIRDGRMQIAYFDPRSGVANPKRPDAFDSNATNRVVLITLMPKP